MPVGVNSFHSERQERDFQPGLSETDEDRLTRSSAGDQVKIAQLIAWKLHSA
jgi:hypothetical protein